LAVADQRPGEFFDAKIRRHSDGEKTPLPPRQKVSGLALIRAAGLNAVIRSDWNLQVLFLIAIVIAEEKIEAAILILEPAFKSAGNALARIVPRLSGQALRSHECRASHDYGTKND
jgi:hypothetical protein